MLVEGLVRSGPTPSCLGPWGHVAGGKQAFRGPKMVVSGPKTHPGPTELSTGSRVSFENVLLLSGASVEPDAQAHPVVLVIGYAG